jgi:hypothetical protein
MGPTGALAADAGGRGERRAGRRGKRGSGAGGRSRGFAGPLARLSGRGGGSRRRRVCQQPSKHPARPRRTRPGPPCSLRRHAHVTSHLVCLRVCVCVCVLGGPAGRGGGAAAGEPSRGCRRRASAPLVTRFGGSLYPHTPSPTLHSHRLTEAMRVYVYVLVIFFFWGGRWVGATAAAGCGACADGESHGGGVGSKLGPHHDSADVPSATTRRARSAAHPCTCSAARSLPIDAVRLRCHARPPLHCPAGQRMTETAHPHRLVPPPRPRCVRRVSSLPTPTPWTPPSRALLDAHPSSALLLPPLPLLLLLLPLALPQDRQ